MVSGGDTSRHYSPHPRPLFQRERGDPVGLEYDTINLVFASAYIFLRRTIMLVAELRQRLAERVGQAVTSGDREDIATVLEYVRAVLIALAQRPEDEEFVLQDVAVDTRTAALILRLHPEHVRYLIRQEKLPAVKENGEFRVALPDIADFTASGRSLQSTMSGCFAQISELIEGRGFVLWAHPQARPESEEGAA
jgi:hypothetical protein